MQTALRTISVIVALDSSDWWEPVLGAFCCMLVVAVALGHAKRLVVWLIETLSEALLLGIFVAYLLHAPGGTGLYVLGTLMVFMFGTGYLLTTLVLRLAWRNPKLWLYSAASAALIIAHLQVYFVAADAVPSFTWPIRVAGGCIVFACTFAGGWLLRRWVQQAASSPTYSA